MLRKARPLLPLPQVAKEARQGQWPRAFVEMKKPAFRQSAENLVSNHGG